MIELKKTSDKNYGNIGNRDILCRISGAELDILDIGCGNGDNGKILFEQGHSIDGITLSESEKKLATPYYNNIHIYNLENGLPTLNKQYDYIICSHVLEHIAYPGKLLNDINNVLKPSGKLLVALPNIMHYQSRLTLLSGKFPYKEAGIWDYTHMRWYTFQSGAALLEQHNFKLLSSSVGGDLPFGRVFKILPEKTRQFLFRGLTKFSKGLFGGQLLYVAIKK